MSAAITDLIPYLTEIKDNQTSQIIPGISDLLATFTEQDQNATERVDVTSQQIDNTSVALDGSNTTRLATRGPKPIPDDLKNICVELTRSIGKVSP